MEVISMSKMKIESLQKVKIFSDGSAKGNSNGPGGYGTIVKYMTEDDEVEKIVEYTEGYKVTTNNRMELMGVICGLESLPYPCEVIIYSDSKYVVDAFNHHWVNNWKSNGWVTAAQMPVKNIDLWKRLLEAKSLHKCKFMWVKGHNGNPDNERCDYLAQSSSNGVKFERKDDGTLTEVKETLKDDAGLNKSDMDTPKIILTPILKEYAKEVIDEGTGSVIKINGVRFVYDEEGNLAPHPDEDTERCKEVIKCINNINKDSVFTSLMQDILLFRGTDSLLCDESNSLFKTVFKTNSKTIPSVAMDSSDEDSDK